jgi:hypothetical protein
MLVLLDQPVGDDRWVRNASAGSAVVAPQPISVHAGNHRIAGKLKVLHNRAVSVSYLRSKLRDHTFAGMKRAGRWAMTEPQIEAAIETMSLDARPPDPPSPSGLSKHSRFGRRLQSQRGA